MKISTHFDLRELVHPDIYNTVGDRCKHFLHSKLAPTLESIKTLIGGESITVNDWLWNGRFESSGLRKPDDIGAYLSSHKFGCAADCKFKTISPIVVQKLIMDNQDDFPYITRMENAEITKTWLHVETGERIGDIVIFNP